METMIVTGGLAQRATHAAFTLRTVRPRATVLLSGVSASELFGSRVATPFPHVADPSQGLGSARTP
ncbi:MAG: hypothetical protein DI571_00150 [Arsenicicoccus sp.]|nr:MAG: hypothetical protein DI571_00150 [Arsenicicoccus sp.]